MCEKYSKTGFLNNRTVSLLFDTTFVSMVDLRLVALRAAQQNYDAGIFPVESHISRTIGVGDRLHIAQALEL
jgi:hypothetical protein